MINERHHFRINLTELTSFSLITLGPRRLFGGSTQTFHSIKCSAYLRAALIRVNTMIGNINIMKQAAVTQMKKPPKTSLSYGHPNR